MMCVLCSVEDDAGVVRRERMAGIYRLSTYFMAIISSEIPIVIVIVTMFVSISYWMANLMPAATNFIAHWLTLLVFAFACQVIISSRSKLELCKFGLTTRSSLFGSERFDEKISGFSENPLYNFEI